MKVSTVIAFAAAMFMSHPGFAQDDLSGATASEISRRLQLQSAIIGVVAIPANGNKQIEGALGRKAPNARPYGHIELDPDAQININIVFDYDSAALRADQRGKLVNLCTALKDTVMETFRIIGHTDAHGPPYYNEKLSRSRAAEVKRYLVSDCGLPAPKLEVLGVGEAYPLEGRDPYAEENRRVEFQLLG